MPPDLREGLIVGAVSLGIVWTWMTFEYSSWSTIMIGFYASILCGNLTGYGP